MPGLRPVFVKIHIGSDKTGNDHKPKHEKPFVTGELTACTPRSVEYDDFVVVPEHGVALAFPDDMQDGLWYEVVIRWVTVNEFG
jgi:hypothetical protein